MLALLLMAVVLAGCRSGGGPEPPPGDDDFTPGTVPAPQPVTTPYPALPDSRVWSQAGANQLRNFKVEVEGPESLGEPQRIRTGAALSSPLHAANGHFFALAGRCIVELDSVGAFIAYHPIPVSSNRFGGPLILSLDGRRIYACLEAHLLAYDLGMNIIWDTEIEGGDLFQPQMTLLPDGAIMLGEERSSNEVWIAVYEAHGDLRWQYTGPGSYFSLLSAELLGQAILLHKDGSVSALSDGELSWNATPQHDVEVFAAQNLPWIGLDGSTYLVSTDGDKTFIEGFSADGTALPLVELSPDRLPLRDATFTGQVFRGSDDGSVLTYHQPPNNGSGTSGQGVISVYRPGDGQVWDFTLPAMERATFARALPGGKYLLGLTLNGSKNRALLLRADGSLEREFATESGIFQLMIPDGEDYFELSTLNALLRRDRLGQQLWRFEGGDHWGSTVFDADGSIYSASDSGIFSITQDGPKLLGPANFGFERLALLSTPQEGLLAGIQGNFIRLGPEGVVDEYAIAGLNLVDSNTVLGADGSVYVFGIENRQVVTVRNARVHWTYTDEFEVEDSGVIDAEGRCWFVSDELGPATKPATPRWIESRLVCLDRAGARLLNLPLGFEPEYGPLLCSDGALLLSSSEGQLRWYSSAGLELARQESSGHLRPLAPLGLGALVTRSTDPAAGGEVDSRLALLGRSGEQWSFDLGGYTLASQPVIDSQDNVFLLLRSGVSGLHLLRLSSSGFVDFDYVVGESNWRPNSFSALSISPSGGLVLSLEDELLVWDD